MQNRGLPRRQRAIADAIIGKIGLLGEAPHSLLDVGCGNGLVAAYLKGAVPSLLEVEGVELLPREGTAIPVRPFNGTELPYSTDQFDIVIICDVLHHIPSMED